MKKRERRTAPRILSYLAQNKPSNKWQIAKALEKSYGNVHATVQDLLELKVIRIECKKPSSKNPKIQVEYYKLTESGLMFVLNEDESLDDHIDTIAKNYSKTVPLIFGKWDFFMKKGLRGEIVQRLEAAAIGFRMQLGRKWYRIVRADRYQSLKVKLKEAIGENKAKEAMANIRDLAPTLTHRVLGPIIFLHEKTHEAWRFIITVIEDEDLRQYYDDAFNNEVTNTKQKYDIWRLTLKHYQKLKASKDS